MAKPNKSKKRSTVQSSATLKSGQLTDSAAMRKQQQAKVRKIFTVVICVVVALGLMLPVAGIGFVSCSGSLDDPSNTSTNSSSSDSN